MTEEHSSRERRTLVYWSKRQISKEWIKWNPNDPDSCPSVVQFWTNTSGFTAPSTIVVAKKRNRPKNICLLLCDTAVCFCHASFSLSPQSPPFSIEQVSSQQSRQKPYFIYTNKVLLAFWDKGSWIFHVLSLLDSLCPPGYWPAGRQWAQEKSSRLLECSSMKLIITCWLRSPWHVWKH